jgi:hypothetical protein
MRTPRTAKPSPSERRALLLRLEHALQIRRKDPTVDPELLLAAVVWPTDPRLTKTA